MSDSTPRFVRDPDSPVNSTAGLDPDSTSRERPSSVREHRPFALVLAGGGARGFAHVGVLRGLERLGYAPSALVGVSMGALVAAGWALRDDWYPVLMGMDTHAFPRPLRPRDGTGSWRERYRSWLAFVRAGRDMFLGWGVGAPAVAAGEAMLRHVTAGRLLEDGRAPSRWPPPICGRGRGS